VLFDNGAGKGVAGQGNPGDPFAAFEHSFSTFPVPGTTARTWYFGPKGALTDRPGARGIDVYTANSGALPLTNFTGGTGGGALWGNASQWSWNWKPNPAGTAVSYVTSALKTDTTVVGAGAVTAWVRSSAPDVDLQVTISEVDPSGHETFVQNGYLRASYRKLATGSHTILGHPSTLLEPVPSFLQRDNRPMPKNAFTKVVVPLYYQGHAYRAGTRIRVTIAAPNGAQPVWSFKQPKPALVRTSTVSIAFSRTMPSSIVLPVIPGLAIPTAQPPCPSLRNEPCRTYTPLVNRTTTR
jgi:predicted acyl esterase